MHRLLFPILLGTSLFLACGDIGEPSEPPMEVSLSRIASDYMKNEAQADNKYDTPLLITGRIRKIESNGILLSGSGRNHVEATFKSKEELFALSRGDTVNLRCDRADGSSDSLGAFVYLKGCELANGGNDAG